MTRTTAQLGASGTSDGELDRGEPLLSRRSPSTFFVPKTSMGVLDLHIKITQGGPQAITATPGMAALRPGSPAPWS